MNINILLNPVIWRSALRNPPKLIRCEICGGPRLCVRTDPHPHPGTRCIGCRSTAKHRAIYKVLQSLFDADLGALRHREAYELSAHGALYAALRRQSRVVGFDLTCSEYVDGAARGSEHNGVRCEDVEALTFESGRFALVTSTDVFEHVENHAAGFAEIRRVLQPGGYYVFTVPLEGQASTVARARRRPDNSIEHLLEPEYHGDPFRGHAGVFTWRNYGFDIVDVMQAAGFQAVVRMVDASGLAGGSLPVVVGHT